MEAHEANAYQSTSTDGRVKWFISFATYTQKKTAEEVPGRLQSEFEDYHYLNLSERLYSVPVSKSIHRWCTGEEKLHAQWC